MFAQLLNQEEKKNFLELIYKIANCDGTFAEEEEELLSNYKLELGLSEVEDTSSMNELMDYFGQKSEQIRKVVFFELYGMIMADGNIAGEESSILAQLKSKFGMAPDAYAQIAAAADQLQAAYDKVYEVLF